MLLLTINEVFNHPQFKIPTFATESVVDQKIIAIQAFYISNGNRYMI